MRLSKFLTTTFRVANRSLGQRNGATVSQIVPKCLTSALGPVRTFGASAGKGKAVVGGDKAPVYDSDEVVTLSDALASEIAEEVSEEAVDQELEDIKALIKKSFTIKDEVGKGVVHLHGSIKGAKVHVQFDCQDEADTGLDMDSLQLPPEGQNGDDDETPSIDFGINFNVRITSSNGDKIVIDCVASQQLQVLNMQHVPAGKDEQDGDLYSGPVFDQLSEGLQDAVYDYLEDHKIDDDMSFFILSYARAKEQGEYVNWLNQLLTTVESKK